MMPHVPTSDDLLRAAMQAENWKREYIDDLLGHMIGMRKAGVSALLAQNLVQLHPQDGYLLTAVDGGRKGHEFGTLRGNGMAVAAYESYMRDRFSYEADEIIDLVIRYAKGVEKSSWAPMVQIVKAMLVQERTAPSPDAYFWKNTNDVAQTWAEAEQSIAALRAKTLDDAFSPEQIRQRDAKLRHAVISWHAFMQELLTNTMFPGNNPATRTVTVVRTESSAAARSFLLNGLPLTEGQLDDLLPLHNVPMTGKRGALESSSLYTVKNIHGHLVTEYQLPYHRVFALYMVAQPKSAGHMLSFFENDTENELAFMPEGLPFVLKSHGELLFAKPTKQQDRFTW